MAATESLMEGGQATFEKNSEKVSFDLEPKNIGLTKEQLEAYRNDPFWKPVRCILFIAFWLAWLAMFAAAIAIVVLSPKCATKQKPDWWQTKVSYQILTPTFHDTDGDGVGDFKGISEKLDLLRKIGVTTIYPSPVIEIQKDEYFNAYDVINHLEVDKRFGTEEDFKQLIGMAHDREMYVVMDLPVSSVSLNHTWFTEGDPSRFVTAQQGQAAYNLDNYYDFPGANNTKYLGYPTASNPVLNWADATVKTTISDAMKKFLLLGVDGFHIDHVSQMAIGTDGKTDHDKSIAALKELTASIKEFCDTHEDLVDKKIVLTSSLRDIEELHSEAKETGDLHYVIDTSFAKISEESCKEGGVAACVHTALDAAYQRHKADSYTPYWQFSSAEQSRLASRFDADTANLMTFMQLTLPGALSLYYGQELGLKDVGTSENRMRGIMQWTPQEGDSHHGFLSHGGIDKLFFGETGGEEDNFESQYALENSPLKVYRKLATLRQRDEALIVGETVRDTIKDDIILYARVVRNNGTTTGSAYVVALNFGDSTASVELFSQNDLIPANKDLAKAEIAVVTSGITDIRSRDKIDLSATPLSIPARQGVLVKL